MRKRMEIALDLIAPQMRKKELSVLEVGCASGDVTKEVIDKFENIKHYDAFDISQKAIAICKSKQIKKVSFWCASTDAIELQDEVYDLILCMDVIYYLNKQQQIECMDKMYHALKKKGHLFVCVPYEKKQIHLLLNMKGDYTIETIALNKNWLWAAIEGKLLVLYENTKNIMIKKLLFRIISNKEIVDFFNVVAGLLNMEKYTHFYILFRK